VGPGHSRRSFCGANSNCLAPEQGKYLPILPHIRSVRTAITGQKGCSPGTRLGPAETFFRVARIPFADGKGISPQLYKLQHSALRRAAQGNLRLAYCFAHRDILWHERLELAQMGRWRAMHELEFIAGFVDLAPLRTTGAWVSGV